MNIVNRVSFLAAVLAATLAAVPAVAQKSPEASKSPDAAAARAKQPAASDLAAIRAASQAFAADFNKRNAKAVAAHWTEDGDYIEESGQTFSGRAAIEKAYAGFFAENPKAQMRIVIDHLRLLSDAAAIEDGRAFVDPPSAGAPAVGKYTAVHVKVGGKWLMSTVRDARVEAPSNHRNVADLEWLIGTWTAEEHGAKTESVCRWVANKSFVERAYTVTGADGTKTEGVQLIGWNPQDGHVQSWNFSPDGGHAVGVWTAKENGWMAETRGVTGDGAPTKAVVLLTRLDDNAYVWQSVQRSLGETALPDTDEVVLKRKPAAR